MLSNLTELRISTGLFVFESLQFEVFQFTWN